MVSKKELKKMLQRYTGFVEKVAVMAYAVDLKIQFEIREAEIAVEKAIEAGEEEAKLNVIKALSARGSPLLSIDFCIFDKKRFSPCVARMRTQSRGFP